MVKESKISDVFTEEGGRYALQLAARGSILIADLLRLAEHVPPEFVDPASTGNASIVCDFSYFIQQETFERRVRASIDLQRQDDEFCETHLALLERFFALFSGIYAFVLDINQFVDDLAAGVYHSQTLQSLLVSRDGRQVLCETLHLYGTLLLLLDYKLGGKTREHLIVSYLRYRGNSGTFSAGSSTTATLGGSHFVVGITRLCCSTGYLNVGSNSSDNGVSASTATDTILSEYPVSYFARVPVRPALVDAVISALRTDDIYQMALNFPAPEHRCCSLALQGALVYVAFFFKPSMLRGDTAVMREVVHRYFDDNWVINYYMGFTADLTVAWAGFPAARDAIAKTVDVQNISYHQERMKSALVASTKEVTRLLHEGTLTEQLALDTIHTELLPLTRQANAVLRWYTLHTARGRCAGNPGSPCSPSMARVTTAAAAAAYEVAARDVSEADLVTLLLATARLEYALRELFTRLLHEKRDRWLSARSRVETILSKLATFFAPSSALSDEIVDSQLSEWFRGLAGRVSALSYRVTTSNDVGVSSSSVGSHIQQLQCALRDVQAFHQIDSNPQAAQMVSEACSVLHRMFRYTSIENRVLVILATVGDLSYAWELMDTYECYVKDIQARIRQRPVTTAHLRSLVVKLSSVLELPCSRVDQCASLLGTTRSEDDCVGNPFAEGLELLSALYSGALVAFTRRVVQVIPVAIFELLRKVMQSLTDDFHESDSKLERAALGTTSAQLRARERLSGYSADIARYAAGMLAMEGVLAVGVVEIKPRELLGDGIRRELVEQVTRELHAGIGPLVAASSPFSATSQRTSPPPSHSQGSSLSKQATAAMHTNTISSRLKIDASLPRVSQGSLILKEVRTLDAELCYLESRLTGTRRAFEYIQDYIAIPGLQVWLAEYERIVQFNVQMECNAFTRKRVYAWNSPFQSAQAPIPFFSFSAGLWTASISSREGQGQPLSASSAPYSFLGRLVQRLLYVTHPKHTIFVPSRGVWVLRESSSSGSSSVGEDPVGCSECGVECLGSRTMTYIAQALGPTGLAALDALLSAIIAKDVFYLVDLLHECDSGADSATCSSGVAQSSESHSRLAALEAILSQLIPHTANVLRAIDLYTELERLFSCLGDTASNSLRGLEHVEVVVERVGRLALIRGCVTGSLRCVAKLCSRALFSAVSTVNETLLAEMKKEANPKVREEEAGAGSSTVWGMEACGVAVETLAPLCGRLGIADIFATVYVPPSRTSQVRPQSVVLLLLALVVRHARHITRQDADYVRSEGSFSRQGITIADYANSSRVVAGLALLLKQFHTDITDALLGHLSQAVRALLLAFNTMKRRATGRDALPAQTEVLVRCVVALAQCTDKDQRDIWRHQPLPLMAIF